MLVRLKNNQGFTLIELVMVLFIISLILGSILTPLSTRLEQDNQNKSSDYVDDIKEALIGFSIINGRLPCPDCPDGTVCAVGTPNDGIQDMIGAVCESNVGNIPWVDLRMREFDSWGRHLTYRVDPQFADTTDGADACDTLTVGVSFELCAQGDIDIYNAYAAPGTYPAIPTVANNVPAILISHGGDGYDSVQNNTQVENYERQPVHPVTTNNILGAYTAANFSANIFIRKNYDSSGTDNFDDVVDWISPNILMSRMVLSGQLP